MTFSLDQNALTHALREILPPQHVGQAEAIATALVTATNGSGNVVNDPALRHAMQSLQGTRIQAGAAQIDFSEVQAGDITIGHVAGGDIISIALTLPQPVIGIEERRRRHAMLTKVRAIWIDGMLARVQCDGRWIELGLTDRPDALDLPLTAQYQELRALPRDHPPGTTINDRFHASGEALLILGAAGSGKTMLLLELCRALLARAGADDAVPTPVILNLASWMARREPLAVWAVRELQRVYDVPTAIGAAWLEANALALLLDGLDEGPPEERGAQIAGINAFRQQSLCPVAVCSRTDDYEGVEAHLRLGGAIAIRPITQEQIDSVLSQAGEAGAATRESLARHQMLDGAVETPLLLNVLLQIRTVGKQLGQDHILQQELWRAYADAVLARRSELRPGEATAIHKRLAWVAAHLQRAGDDTIRLEELNEGWLPEQNRFLVRWVFPALGLMVVALFGYFLRWLVADGLTARGLELGLLQRIAPAVNALNAVVVAGFAAAFARDRIDTLEWSWADARRFLPWTPLALLGAFAMANLNATGSLRSFALFGLIALGVTIVVSLAITVGLGLRPTVIPTLAPGQVLSRAARTGALLGFGSLVFGLISGLLGGLLIYGLFSWLDGIPLRATLGNVIQSGRNGLNIGYLIGLALGLYFGGYATLRHWAIRLSLVISGTLPLRLVRFLDRCVERALLRQVGSGYSFTHKLLLEHYAARDKTDDTDGTSGGTAQALDHTL